MNLQCTSVIHSEGFSSRNVKLVLFGKVLILIILFNKVLFVKNVCVCVCVCARACVCVVCKKLNNKKESKISIEQ